MKNIIAIFVVSVFCISCSSSNISINANIPESQEVDIQIQTKNKPTNQETVMEQLKTVINYVKNHGWDYVDAALGAVIGLLLFIIIVS